MKKTLITSIIAAAGLAVSGLALAAAPAASHWYVGIGANYNAIQKDTHKFNSIGPFDDPVMELDDHDIGLNLIVGNRLTDHFANEFGFNLVGDTQWKGHAPDESGYVTFKVNDIYHVYYDGYFYIPLMHPSLEAFAKGGVSYLEAKNTVKLYCSEGITLSHSTIRTFALNYGAGVQFNADKFGLRGEYTRVVPNHDSDLLHVFADTINLDFLWFLT